MVTIWRGVARDVDDRPEWFSTRNPVQLAFGMRNRHHALRTAAESRKESLRPVRARLAARPINSAARLLEELSTAWAISVRGMLSCRTISRAPLGITPRT